MISGVGERKFSSNAKYYTSNIIQSFYGPVPVLLIRYLPSSQTNSYIIEFKPLLSG